MAARMNRGHQAQVREKIKTSQLINRLTNHALGELDVPMDSSQVRAVECLLKKTLPDLSSVESTTEHSGEVTIKWQSE